MERITIDAALAARLHELAEQGKRVQLVDAAGRVVADAAPRPEIGNLEDEFTPEQIERMFAPDHKWYTVEEVIARLRSIP